MDSFTLTRKIEAVNHVRDICVRFYGLQNGADIWLDAQELFNHQHDMASFLQEHCELTESEAKAIVDTDYEIIGAEGLCESCLTQPKGFDWDKYKEIAAAREDFDDEVIKAAIACDVCLPEIGDKYAGQYKSWVEFVEETFDEISLYNIPSEYHSYIDYEKIANDWHAEGSYSYYNGHVFRGK